MVLTTDPLTIIQCFWELSCTINRFLLACQRYVLHVPQKGLRRKLGVSPNLSQTYLTLFAYSLILQNGESKDFKRQFQDPSLALWSNKLSAVITLFHTKVQSLIFFLHANNQMFGKSPVFFNTLFSLFTCCQICHSIWHAGHPSKDDVKSFLQCATAARQNAVAEAVASLSLAGIRRSMVGHLWLPINVP